MIYCYNVTFSANTSSTSREEFVLPLDKGLIYKLAVRFPPGSAGLARFTLDYAGYQLYPRNQRGYFSGNDELIDDSDIQLLESEPYELIARGYNLDVAFDHMVIIRIGVLSEQAYISHYIPSIEAERARREAQENEAKNEKAQINLSINLPFRTIKK